ncbi:hypothetical protein GA0115245_15235 [Streptomyces sp. di188]|nr:hypothetical protein GA0115245_15235 [Streptomyces sp. di188]
MQFPEYGLDTEVTAFIEERQYLRRVVSSSWAKKLRRP